LTALGGLPTSDELIFERFFDEAGGMQLVVHAPLGGRINRALCLALRKKFCRSFNFELQAAANDDAMVLSLGPHHSFPLESVPRFLNSSQVAETLAQAALASPMFTARWRWNLNRSLMVLRFKGGRRNPPPIQRMEADDLMAAVFPNQAACQENVTFPIEIPSHPLVRQTMEDCLNEGMDVVGLEALVRGFEEGGVRTRFVDTSEPSPLAHEILNGRPFTFLDDAPLEIERPYNPEPWRPENYDHKFRGPVSVREALERSLNVPAVRLGQRVGIARVSSVAVAATHEHENSTYFAVLTCSCEYSRFNFASERHQPNLG
jgi:ATP-dependent Lhr-like helicase